MSDEIRGPHPIYSLAPPLPGQCSKRACTNAPGRALPVPCPPRATPSPIPALVEVAHLPRWEETLP